MIVTARCFLVGWPSGSSVGRHRPFLQAVGCHGLCSPMSNLASPSDVHTAQAAFDASRRQVAWPRRLEVVEVAEVLPHRRCLHVGPQMAE